MTNAIMVSGSYSELKDQAHVAAKSGLFAGKTEEQILVIMLKGRELGVAPMQALDGINVISGKPSVAPQLMLALIYNRHPGASVEVRPEADKCTVTMCRNNGIPHVTVFTMQDAAAMGLANKDNYKKQPSVMLQWRAISACARVAFPDIIQGMYTPEELNPDATFDYETGAMIQDAQPVEDMSKVDAMAEAYLKGELPQPTQPPASEAPSRKNGKGNSTLATRPWDAPTLQKQIAIKVSKSGLQGGITDSQKQKAAIAFGGWFPDVANAHDLDNFRHTIQGYLFGKQSLLDFTKAEASVWIDYLESGKPEVAGELNAVITEDALSKGQTSLWDELGQAVMSGEDGENS